MVQIRSPKKLIEVALPLDDINAACAHEKMPGIGPHRGDSLMVGYHAPWRRHELCYSPNWSMIPDINARSVTV